MTEAEVIALVEKGLFVKFGLLTALIFALTLTTSAGHLLRTGAHRICQAAGMPAVECSTS